MILKRVSNNDGVVYFDFYVAGEVFLVPTYLRLKELTIRLENQDSVNAMHYLAESVLKFLVNNNSDYDKALASLPKVKRVTIVDSIARDITDIKCLT